MNKKISTRLGTLIILLFAVALGGGALAYFYINQPTSYDYEVQCPSPSKIKEKSTDKTIVSETKKPTVTISDTITLISYPDENELIDWQGYENKTYGFNFQYPKSWSLSDEISSDGSLDLFPTGQRPEIVGELSGDIIVKIYQNPKNLTLENFYNDLGQGNPYQEATKSIEKVRIDGNEAVKFNDVEGEWVYTIVGIPKGSLVYEFTDEGEKHLQDGIFDKIISTIKFAQ